VLFLRIKRNFFEQINFELIHFERDADSLNFRYKLFYINKNGVYQSNRRGKLSRSSWVYSSSRLGTGITCGISPVMLRNISSGKFCKRYKNKIYYIAEYIFRYIL